MGYSKTTWENGDVITSEKLNKLEQGAADANAGPLEATGVMSVNGSGKKVITLDKTAAEAFAAAEAGRLLKLTVELTVGEAPDTVDMTVTSVMPFVAAKTEYNGNVMYGFAARPDTDGNNTVFFAENLAGTDTVALTEAGSGT